MNDEINKILEVLNMGGIILYPTDTIWGIGCDATNQVAVSKVYRIKERMEAKSMIVLLDNENKLSSYVSFVPSVAYQLIEYAEKPLTIIYSGAKNLAENVIAKDGSIGIRIVKDVFCQKLIEKFRKPIVSTSANVSGHAFPKSFDEISDEIKDKVDYIVSDTYCDKNFMEPSTIVKIELNGRFVFIRK